MFVPVLIKCINTQEGWKKKYFLIPSTWKKNWECSNHVLKKHNSTQCHFFIKKKKLKTSCLCNNLYKTNNKSIEERYPFIPTTVALTVPTVFDLGLISVRKIIDQKAPERAQRLPAIEILRIFAEHFLGKIFYIVFTKEGNFKMQAFQHYQQYV